MGKATTAIKQTAGAVLRSWWRINHGRKFRAFGQDCTFTADTEFPVRPRVPLPAGDSRSNIVRYGDLVQFHSIARLLADVNAGTVVDVGAHHGIYAIIVGKILRQSGGRLFAIEPAADAFDVLRENVRLNDLQQTVHCIRAAVMDRPGTVRLSAEGPQSSVSSRDAVQCVEAITLESLLQEHKIPRVHLLQVDVEGAELPVLRGYPWGRVPVDAIFCELHPYAWPAFGYGGNDVAAFLKAHDLRCVDTYLMEHTSFDRPDYIGPTRLIHSANGRLHP